MVALSALWLPILVAAVFVFVASSVIHMATRIHKTDYKKLPNEGAALDALRSLGIAPGMYMFPCASSMKEMKSPEFAAKFERGPVGLLTLRPNGTIDMGKALGQWFALTVAISVFAAYVAGRALGPGAEAMSVMQLTATVAFVGYGLSSVTNSIWHSVAWSVTLKFLFDGLVYAAATGAAFVWLWPGA